jgi:superfamily II DNA/RNA helicase
MVRGIFVSSISKNDEIMLLLNKHFRNVEDAAQRSDTVVYVHAWLFIKSLISAAFDIDINSEITNPQIIDNYIYDTDLSPKLHNIRINRNIYEHGDTLSLSPNDSRSVLETINELIDFVNYMNKRGFHFSHSAPISKVEGHSAPISEVEGISFTNELAGEITGKQALRYIKKREKITYYKVGYSAQPLYFSISNVGQNVTTHPAFAVVHNLLIRGRKIKESSYLSSLQLKQAQLELVFIYEILILNAICDGRLENNNVIEVNEEHLDLVQHALNDIYYYIGLISDMSNIRHTAKIKLRAKKMTENSIALFTGDQYFSASIVDSEHCLDNATVWLASKIPYRITRRNYQSYNTMLKEICGYEAFREGQLAAFDSILSSANNYPLIILPTGYGKSLIYQFLSLLQPCISIVVSPTYHLIYDQIQNLKDLSIDRIGIVDKKPGLKTANINSFVLRNASNLFKDSHAVFHSTLNYATPFELLSENLTNTLQLLESAELVNFIAIDECHQMSIWGHKFEAEYFTLIKQVTNILSNTQIVLLSATASHRVKSDIKEQFSKHRVIVVQPTPLDRGNISYQFIEKNSVDDIISSIAQLLDSNFGTGSTLDCSELRSVPSLTLIINNDVRILQLLFNALLKMKNLGPYCCIYQGEQNTYKRFRLANKTIILATDDYLAGINVPFLRNLIIIGCPPSKEWFYQETGRVGRYGESSVVITYMLKKESHMLKTLLQSGSFSELQKAFVASKSQELSDLSNLQFILHDLRNIEKELDIINKIFSDIGKTVWVSETYQYGRVRGVMRSEKKSAYDFALFLMYFMGIIIRWLYRSEQNNNLEYAIEVNMEIDNGTLAFENQLIKKVKQLSSSERIKTYYINTFRMVNDDFNELFKHTINWFHENAVSIKRQMFINIYQLIKENIGTSNVDKKIEENLSEYFGTKIGDIFSLPWHSRDYEIIGQSTLPALIDDAADQSQSVDSLCDANTEPVTISSESPEADSILSINSEVGGVDTEEDCSDLIERVDISTPHKASIQLHTENIVARQEAAPADETANRNSYEAPLRKEAPIDDKPLGNHTSLGQLDFCLSDQELTPSQVSAIILNIQTSSEIWRVRLERAIENSYYLNLEVALAVCEMTLDQSTNLYRTRNIIENISDSLRVCILMLLENCLKSQRKRQIDLVLQRAGKDAFYYSGFVKKIKYYIDRLLGR